MPFIAVAAASISRLMLALAHSRTFPTCGMSLLCSSTGWRAIQSIEILARARRALNFVALSLREKGSAGQPIWPIVPSSLYCAFTAGRLRDLRVLVISYDASVHGWGAIILESADPEG